jgi:hypothetical protein
MSLEIPFTMTSLTQRIRAVFAEFPDDRGPLRQQFTGAEGVHALADVREVSHDEEQRGKLHSEVLESQPGEKQQRGQESQQPRSEEMGDRGC